VEGLYDVPWLGASQAAPASDGCGPGLLERDPYTAGTLTLEFLSGFYPKANIGPAGPVLDYLPQSLRLGVLCNDPHPHRTWISGVFELMLEYNYLYIARSFGNYFTGPCAILRYSFARPECLLAPYIQGGAGVVFTDAWRDQAQHLIGEELEFYLHTEVGFRLMLTEDVAVNVEAGFQHISNANLAPRNGGLNTLGGSIGLTWFFP
jgi:hypothetical protein